MKSILLRLLQPVFARRANTVVEALSATRRPPPPPSPPPPPPTPPPRFAQLSSIPQVVPTTSSRCYKCTYNRRHCQQYQCLNLLPHDLPPHETTKAAIDILLKFWYGRICFTTVTYILGYRSSTLSVSLQWLPQRYKVCFTLKASRWLFPDVIRALSISLVCRSVSGRKNERKRKWKPKRTKKKWGIRLIEKFASSINQYRLILETTISSLHSHHVFYSFHKTCLFHRYSQHYQHFDIIIKFLRALEKWRYFLSL